MPPAYLNHIAAGHLIFLPLLTCFGTTPSSQKGKACVDAADSIVAAFAAEAG